MSGELLINRWDVSKDRSTDSTSQEISPAQSLTLDQWMASEREEINLIPDHEHKSRKYKISTQENLRTARKRAVIVVNVTLTTTTTIYICIYICIHIYNHNDNYRRGGNGSEKGMGSTRDVGEGRGQRLGKHSVLTDEVLQK